MNISIQTMTLVNFKGVRNLTVNFDQTTDIFGNNATGKTTLFDAFAWLLFGKDSSDRKDFNIKPMDQTGATADQVECEVSADLSVDGRTMNLKRVFREKWQKKKGSEEAEFTGNETVYYWNDVPLQQKEYQSKIETLVDESIFKLITNPLYFNSLKWQDRRGVLLKMAGEIHDSEVLTKIINKDNAGRVDQLVNILNSGKTIAEFKKEISAKKKKAADELKLIPSRIDEATRSKPVFENVQIDLQAYFNSLRTDNNLLKGSIAEIDEKLQNQSKITEGALAEKLKVQKRIFELKGKVQALEFQTKQDLINAEQAENQKPLQVRREITDSENTISRFSRSIADLKNQKVTLEAGQQPAREEWIKINSSVLEFDDNQFHCPTCKREYEASDVEAKKQELTENFNTDKVRRLTSIQESGKSTKIRIEGLQTDIETQEQLKSVEESKLAELKDQFQKLTTGKTDKLSIEMQLENALQGSDEHRNLKRQIAEAAAELELVEPDQRDSDFIAELKAQKETLNNQIEANTRSLAGEETIKRADERIAELKVQEKKLAQEVTGYDALEFTMDEFNRSKMEVMESRINGLFKLAKFRMFNKLVNGGEEEACETTYNGVPWSDLNTAGKIATGIDIINALSAHYSVSGPIWIDNRESTVSIPETGSQVVNLIVSEADEKLRVESKVSKLQVA